MSHTQQSVEYNWDGEVTIFTNKSLGLRNKQDIDAITIDF